MRLQTLCFEGDYALEKREKEKSNYCYVNLYAATFGIAQFILTELQPIDLDGYGKLTICANVELQNETYEPGYHTSPELGVSWYILTLKHPGNFTALNGSAKRSARNSTMSLRTMLPILLWTFLWKLTVCKAAKIALQSDVTTFWRGCGSADAKRRSCSKNTRNSAATKSIERWCTAASVTA